MLEHLSKSGAGDIPVIVYTAKGDFQRCVRAVQLGAYNFFDKEETSVDQLIRSIENAIEHRHLILENKALRRASRQDSPIVGASQAIDEVRKHIGKIAEVPSSVLILGESGTGKELVAREIHRLSPRVQKPFVAVNCAAIPENLVESELFGFEKGAFSGAVRTSKGKFEAAHSGTLFLDEIGDMPLPIQAKLLRVLESGEVSRLGAEGRVVKVDVRVIAATHRELEAEIENGSFRRDLYFRICTHIIRVPPLRERLEDVKPLTLHFVERICERFGIPQKQIHPDTLSALRAYDWHKNNIRELENIIERIIIGSDGTDLLLQHVPLDIRDASVVTEIPSGKSFQELRKEAERQILLRSLEANGWHITNTAKTLGIANHSNLLKMMRRLGITRPK
jgi:DNA-binding NtrC family response regulator